MLVASVCLNGCCSNKKDVDPPAPDKPVEPSANTPKTTTLMPESPPANTPGQAAAAPGAMANDGLPVQIPEAHSAVPTIAEWNAVPREITVNRSTPLNCETKMVREWLRVSCREKNNTGGTPKAVDKLRGCSSETFLFAKPEQKIASVVMPVRRGNHCEVRFSWTDKTQSLVMDWPSGPRPTIKFEGQWP
jgi:hypothetical protein